MSKKSKNKYKNSDSDLRFLYCLEPMNTSRKEFEKIVDKVSIDRKKDTKKKRSKNKISMDKKKKQKLVPITNDVQATTVKISDAVIDAERLQRLPADRAVIIFENCTFNNIINDTSEPGRNEIFTDDYVVTEEESYNE